MGKQSPPVQLTPLPEAISVFDTFIARQPETLILKEKVLSLSGDSFTVNTIDGRPVLQVKGDAFSLSGRKMVMDMSGNHMFTIRKKHFSFPATYYAEDPQGNQFFDVDFKFGIGSSKAVSKFHSRRGREETLSLKGRFMDWRAEIKDEASGMTVATIDRKLLSGRDFFAGQQTYAVMVAPGMDMSLIVAMCISLDERNEKN